MKKWTAGLMAAAMLTGAGMAMAAGEHEGHGMHHGQQAAAAQTIEGEVIDAFCYLSHPANGKGPGHKKCAETCIKNGLPIGILESKTGRVYIAVGNNHQPATEALLPFVAKKVKVTGKILEGNGATMIAIERVQG